MTEQTSLEQFTQAAERAANQVISAYSTSFGLATRALGPRHRQHVRNIYALVRVADELVDGLTAEAGLSRQQQVEALEHFIAETHRAMQLGCSSDLVVHAFAGTARAVGIDESLTQPFFDSMRTDLREQDAATESIMGFGEDAHESYVFGSAEVIGLMCLRVFLQGEQLSDEDSRELERGARKLGAAFQNINFLRDLSDDTERLGRSYLGPNERINDAERVAWVDTIRGQLDEAARVIPKLPRDARVAVRSALLLFTALTDRIERARVDELYRRRVRVPNPVKIGLTARAALTTWMEPQK